MEERQADDAAAIPVTTRQDKVTVNVEPTDSEEEAAEILQLYITADGHEEITTVNGAIRRIKKLCERWRQADAQTGRITTKAMGEHEERLEKAELIKKGASKGAETSPRAKRC